MSNITVKGYLIWRNNYDAYESKYYPDVSIIIRGNIYAWGGFCRGYYFNQIIKEVSDNNELPNDLDLISDILWEMTFNGWVEDESTQFFEDMSQEIKKLIEENENK